MQMTRDFTPREWGRKNPDLSHQDALLTVSLGVSGLPCIFPDPSPPLSKCKVNTRPSLLWFHFSFHGKVAKAGGDRP